MHTSLNIIVGLCGHYVGQTLILFGEFKKIKPKFPQNMISFAAIAWEMINFYQTIEVSGGVDIYNLIIFLKLQVFSFVVEIMKIVKDLTRVGKSKLNRKAVMNLLVDSNPDLSSSNYGMIYERLFQPKMEILTEFIISERCRVPSGIGKKEARKLFSKFKELSRLTYEIKEYLNQNKKDEGEGEEIGEIREIREIHRMYM